jgi:hypothetical protein
MIKGPGRGAGRGDLSVQKRSISIPPLEKRPPLPALDELNVVAWAAVRAGRHGGHASGPDIGQFMGLFDPDRTFFLKINTTYIYSNK